MKKYVFICSCLLLTLYGTGIDYSKNGEIYTTILEKNSLELKRFNETMRELFRAKSTNERTKIIQQLTSLGSSIVDHANKKLKSDLSLTQAQRECLEHIIVFIKDKLGKLTES